MKKTVHYRRAIWSTEDQLLSTCLESRFANIDPQIAPIFAIDSSLMGMVARRNVVRGARYIHFVCYEQGAPVAVINTQVAAPVAEADELPPIREREYIISQLFCLFAGNHILWTTHNEPYREGKLHQILSAFLIEHGAQDRETQFGFQVVLDQGVVQRALESGIEEIDLGVGAFRPTLERISSGGQLSEVGILGTLASIFQHPASSEQLAAAADVEAKLVLRPGREWDKPIVKDLMVQISDAIRNDYEYEFAIMTKAGIQLTRDKISLKSECEVQGNRRVLDSAQMEVQLRQVLAEMQHNGVLDA